MIPKPVAGSVIFTLSFFGFFASRLPRCCLFAMTLIFKNAKPGLWRPGWAHSPGRGKALTAPWKLLN
jgi:hypothetical protein